MLKIKKIAVTGGLSTGKTTVCRLFKHLGAYVVNADEIVHQLLSPDTPLGQKIIDLLGPNVVIENKFDRKKIADQVFSQPDSLRALEQLIHPKVFDEIEIRYQKIAKDKNYPLFVAEIPLLYEAAKQDQFDHVIYVSADYKLCEQRYICEHRSNTSDFIRRMQRQMPSSAKAKKADFIIENNGSVQQLEQTVKAIFLQLTQE